MFCWHKWTKWEQYHWSGTAQSGLFSKTMISCSEERQKRHCEKCGKEQDKPIYGS
jgi:hypothetical protein